MNTDMKEHVIKLLEGYSERERQIALLHYEMLHTARVSPEEVIDSMSMSHSDDIGGGSSRGHISNKTMFIALNYQERMDHLNIESMDEIAGHLLELKAEQDRIRYYVTLLEKREAEVIRLFYFEGHSKEDIAKKIKVVQRTVNKIKTRAIDHLVELYTFTSDLS